MKNSQKKTAVILFHIGGPDTLENVKPFLFNLFNDKANIRFPQPFRFFVAKFLSSKKEKTTQTLYSAIGRKSPILNRSLEQAHSLERELSYCGNFKTFVSMKYAEPFAQDVVEDVLKYNPDEAILLPLYPHFSNTISGSSLEDFATQLTAKLKKKSQKINLKFVCCYPEDVDFVRAHALLIQKTVQKDYHNNIEDFQFVFTAHGLPQKVINGGDPYVFQIEKTTHRIIENLAHILDSEIEKINFQICYQSKIGKSQGNGPSLDLALKRTVLNKKIPVIVPISSVLDNLETLSELDIDYQKMAKNFGAEKYLRVPTLNTDGHFIKSLTEICKNVSAIHHSKCFSGREHSRICPKKFTNCPNFNACTE